MPRKSRQRATAQATAREMSGWVMVLVSALVGLANSVYLLVTHVQVKTGGEVGGYCDISLRFNCRGAVDSAYSVLLGVPVPVWAIGFYAAMALYVLKARPSRLASQSGWSLVVVGYAVALLYSLFLLGVLLFELTEICPGCLVLDSVNAIGLAGALLATGVGLSKLPAKTLGDLRTAALGPPGIGFIVVFGLIFAATSLITVDRLAASTERVPPEEAYDIVVDHGARQVLAGAEEAPWVGSDEAQVVIVEFSDFQCPYCRRFALALERLRESHAGEVQLRFMNYPLNSDCNPHIDERFHADACTAARAAVCAQDQNRFWELHDLMFANSRHLDRESVLQMAQSLGVDIDEFEACLDSDYSLDRVVAQVNAGYEAVTATGVTSFGTPFSFVNGLLVRGARSYAEMEALTERELEGQAAASGDVASDQSP